MYDMVSPYYMCRIYNIICRYECRPHTTYINIYAHVTVSSSSHNCGYRVDGGNVMAAIEVLLLLL